VAFIIGLISFSRSLHRGPQQTQTTTHGLCTLPAGSQAKWRRAECHRGNAIKGKQKEGEENKRSKRKPKRLEC